MVPDSVTSCRSLFRHLEMVTDSYLIMRHNDYGGEYTELHGLIHFHVFNMSYC